MCYTILPMATKQQHYHDRIITDPQVLTGKPVVKGTRIPVELVLEYLAYDPDVKTLFEAFPRLTLEDVKACLAYAQEKVEEEKHQRQAHV
jgi:uncharacterized protein (DUF433 family)